MNDTRRNALSYRDAGVDIDAGNTLVERIKPAVRRTHRDGVLGGLGGFGGLFELPGGYSRPVLVSGADGVGTKLKLAIDAGDHSGIGTDLVAMCVNDVLVTGAEPLYFLDYYATGALDVDTATTVIEGIAHGCEQAGCALLGGETAEMPGLYQNDDYDLAGFCVGVVEHDNIIDTARVAPGDCIVALPSSGPHSNGYSLIRKVLEQSGDTLDTRVDGETLRDLLLAPTRIYVRGVLAALEAHPVHAMAHITGGGLTENIPRVLPAHTAARIELGRWQQPSVFDWLAQHGGIEAAEMRRTFNCGIGFTLIVPETAVDGLCAALEANGESPFVVGQIEARGDAEPIRFV
ncbi:MAG: phosphoribosylformylglycinamidine cyclo-ligase [Pseudomonadota bacterium]